MRGKKIETKSEPNTTHAPDRTKNDSKNVINASDRKKNDPNSVARIRYRVLKMLQQHDPAKVDKIDAVMAKFEGRETELLEKMMARYHEGCKDETKSVASTAESRESTPTSPTSDDGRPKSRQDKALERHMARMKRIRASADKE